MLTYRCTEHRWEVQVDIEHRHVKARAAARGASQCHLLRLAHLAFLDPEHPLGDHGVWDPRTGRRQCHVVLLGEGATS